MDRLTLDYQYLFNRWHSLTTNLRIQNAEIYLKVLAEKQPSSANAVLPILKEKLLLFDKIISKHQDISNCSGCGQCCEEFPFTCHFVEFLHLLPHMATCWSHQQQKEFFIHNLGMLNSDGTNKCPFLTSQGCLVYPVRPLLCRRAICGDHICNKLDRDFDNLGEWCNNSSIITQLTTMNMLYYYIDDNHNSSYLGWPVQLSNGEQNTLSQIGLAPIEIWLLILLDKNQTYRSILQIDEYKPIIKYLYEKR